MADWKNLTRPAKDKLIAAVRAGLAERGIDATAVDLDPSGLPGRYRLFVVSEDFAKLDYTERLSVVGSVLDEKWDRFDRLRLTLTYPLSPDEVPEEQKAKPAPNRASQTRRRARQA